MTKEQKIEAYTMILDGCTLTEVGDKFGISKQRVSQMFPQANKKVDAAAEGCVYPNISKWMVEHRAGFASIARGCGSTTPTIRYALTSGGSIRKDLIDALLRLTGMTYEEAFFRE
jgi:hypothetical protein